eukprot:11622362-Heterocapsa_arctica.AAC.1
MTWPPEVTPGDLIVSRLSCEISKRLPSVRDVLKVRSQAPQQRATRKRTKISEGLEFVGTESEETE